MKTFYRIILCAEDGETILRDGYETASKAEYVAERLAENYGEGQRVFVEQYTPTRLW